MKKQHKIKYTYEITFLNAELVIIEIYFTLQKGVKSVIGLVTDQNIE